MNMRGTAAGVLVALLAITPAAHADTPPTLWQGVADPGARDRYALHVRVRQILDFEARVELAKFGALDHARALLEDARAETSPDVRLRFDLGEVYYALDLLAEAVRVLEPAIRSESGHPGALEALTMLAYAHAKLDHPREERDAYVQYLARAVDPGERVTATLNLAESEMRLVNMPASIAGYEETLALAAQLPPTHGVHDTTALAVWGLAVALDRSGATFNARKEAVRAIGLDPGMAIIGHGQNVFFVPDYERLWYLALGAAAEAETAQNPHEALAHRKAAELYFKTFVTRARPKDPWLALARVRLKSAESARVAAEGVVARSKVKPPITDDPRKVFTF